jgi:hypothetical protein
MRGFLTRQLFTNTRKGLEHRFTSGQHDGMQKRGTEEKYTKLVIDWRHLQEDRWFELYSKLACVHSQQELQQSCCICVRIIQLDSRIKRHSSWRRIVRSQGVWWRNRPYSFLFSSEAWFYRSGYWSSDNLIFLHEVPLHDRLVCGGVMGVQLE